MKHFGAAVLLFCGLLGSGLGVPHPVPDPSILGDNMQSFTEDPYVTDEKFREKGRHFGILAFGILAFAFGIWHLAFGIWNLEFGIWNLESGIRH